MGAVKGTVTIRDVANAAGVSVSTVSRVLNDKDDVSESTYAHVQQIIEELGYTSSLAARSMRSRKNHVIGLILTNMDQSFSMQVIRSVGRAVKEHGYDLFAYTSHARPQDTLEKWEQQSVSLLNGSIADGVIIVTPHARSFRTECPLVAIDPHSQGAEFPAVISTNYAGAVSAMEYLIGLGHRRIGFIGGRPDLQSAIRRQEGYCDALKAAGLPIDEALIQVGDYTQETGYGCAQRLLGLAQRPTAIFAANDDAAFGALEAIRDADLRVPEDLSLIGFDNTAEAAGANPPLTSVDQAIAQMGQSATAMLIQLIEGKSLDQQLHKVPTNLIVRHSCQPLSDPQVRLEQRQL